MSNLHPKLHSDLDSAKVQGDATTLQSPGIAAQIPTGKYSTRASAEYAGMRERNGRFYANLTISDELGVSHPNGCC